MLVQIHVFNEVSANVLGWLGSDKFNWVNHDRGVKFDVKEEY